MKKKKIVLLYLKTGGGHQAAAKALSEELTRKGDAVPVMFDPLEEHQNIIKEMIEGGYSRLSSELKFLWPLFYELSNTEKSVKSIRELSRLLFTNRVERMLEEEKPDSIIILHFLLIAPVAQALNHLSYKPDSVVTIVLDPFSVHHAWYSDNPFPIYCFSDQAVETILSEGKERRSNVLQFPVIISQRFTGTSRNLNWQSHSDHRRRILILGGGEGSSSSMRFLRYLAEQRPDLSIDFVCGKSERLYEQAHRFVRRNRIADNVRIHGFVPNIEDYIASADLVLTKAGPATIMECLLIGRPLIIYDYLYGQERGNVDFIEENSLGVFIDTPQLLEKRIDEFLSRDYRKKFGKKLESLNLRSGTEEIVNSILGRVAG